MQFKKTVLNAEIAALTSMALLASVPVSAQQSALEEVVVTATRRSESVQDIPYNISAISGLAIERAVAMDLNALTRSIPGVAGPDLGSRAGVNNAIIMRGINVSDPAQGSVVANLTASTVSTYINNTPLFTNFRLVDIERVEVLRGPQGTLYGSGAMGGTLRLITKSPDLTTTTGQFTAGVSNNEESDEFNYQAQGIFNIPISDTIAVRGGVSYEDIGGVVDVTKLLVLEDGIPAKVDPSNPDSLAVKKKNKDVDSAEIWFGRVGLLWAPTDSTEVNLNYMLQDENWDHSTTAYIGDQKSLGGGADSWEDSPEYFDKVERTVNLGSLDIESDFGFATFTSSTSYSEDDSKPTRDTSDFYETLNAAYYFNYPRMNALGDTEEKREIFTQEFRLVSNGGGAFDWVAGAYYQDDQLTQNIKNPVRGFGEWADDPDSSGSQIVAYYYGASGLTTVGDFIEFGLGGIRPSSNDDEAFLFNYNSKFTDLAAYGELTWHATDAWQLTVGARVFHQQVEGDLKQQLLYCGPACSDDGVDPNGVTTASDTSEFDDQIYKFNTSYDITDDQMVYATVSQGFRRGGANALPQVGPYFDPGFPKEYDPDKLLNYEAGLKGYLWDRRVSYTAAAYYIEWEDVQLETFNAGGFKGVVNGDTAESTGFELESTASLTDNLTVTVGYSYVNAEISKTTVIVDRSAAGLPNDVVYNGDDLPYVSDNQASIALDYTQALSNGMTMDFHVDGNYRSGFKSQVNPDFQFDNYREFDGYSMWNASASLARDAWQATLWCRNIGNEEGLSSAIVRDANVTPAAEFGRRGFVTRPRSIGLRFSYYFE